MTYNLFLFEVLNKNVCHSWHIFTQLLYFWVTWCLTSSKCPFHPQLTSCRRGHTEGLYSHTSWCSRIGAIGKVSVHPCGSFGQGHSTGRASFCSAFFVYLSVELCKLDISEFSACSCYRCCVRCYITWCVVACTACRLDTPVAPVLP